MLTVSILVEILRSQPRLVFWFAMLLQTVLWTLVPGLFYAAPPGDLPEVLAVGHVFRLGTDLGPPLAYWLAEIVFVAARHHLIAIYLLSQICVGIAYWAVFRLGSAIVGERHAALAVLLMAGVSALTLPTPEFGPAILAMPFWALALLHYWRAAGEGRSRYWFALALDLGLLLLTTYMGIVLLALMIGFTAATARGRAAAMRIEPALAGLVVIGLLFPHLIWLDQASDVALPQFKVFDAAALGAALSAWSGILLALVVGHAGLLVLVAMASKIFRPSRGEAPIILRRPADAFARYFIYFFAVAPALAVTLLVAFVDHDRPVTTSPLVILSGLAVVVFAGDAIRIHNQLMTSWTWLGLAVAPPVLAAAAVILLPWTIGTDLRIAQPATEIGRFFTDSFERRTGKPFMVVGGDRYLSALIALASPRRPMVYREAAPKRAAWVGDEDLARHGAVIVWPATDTQGTPPPDIKARFPDLVAELPRGFERTFQGRLPLLRIGWGVIRPREAAPGAPQ